MRSQMPCSLSAARSDHRFGHDPQQVGMNAQLVLMRVEAGQRQTQHGNLPAGRDARRVLHGETERRAGKLGLERHIGTNVGAGAHDIAFNAKHVRQRAASGRPRLMPDELDAQAGWIIQRDRACAACKRSEIGGANDHAIGAGRGESRLPVGLFVSAIRSAGACRLSDAVSQISIERK